MKNLPKLIALAGLMGSGKSTVADYLVREHGYTRTRFAGPLKSMLAAFLTASGSGALLARRMVDGDLKEQPSPLLGGRTPRHAMQTLGTEWGRELISPSIWTDAWAANAESIILQGGRVVVDDCRFPNEAALIAKMNGWLIEVVNARLPVAANDQPRHASEEMLFSVDATLKNDGVMLPALHKAVDDLLFTLPVMSNLAAA